MQLAVCTYVCTIVAYALSMLCHLPHKQLTFANLNPLGNTVCQLDGRQATSRVELRDASSGDEESETELSWSIE